MADSARVLYLRDAGMADRAADTLEDAGYEVVVAESLPEAMETLRETAADCVITNYEIPDADGVTFLGALEVVDTIESEYPDLPIIVYSAVESHDLATEALEADVFDYVPARPGTNARKRLLRRVESAITRQETRIRARKQTRINRTIRTVNEALIRAQSRSEVDRWLVDELASSERYLAAAVASVDDSVTVRTAATGRVAGADPHQLAFIRPLERAASSESPVVVDLEARSPNRNQTGTLEHGTEMLAACQLTYRKEDYGVLAVYTDRPNAFDEEERGMIADLARNGALALHTIETRETLIDRTRELEARTERLERLARIISHELRNPLQSAMARVDLAQQTGDVDHLDIVTENHQEIEQQVQNLVEFAKPGTHDDDPTTVSLTATVDTAWQRVGPVEATLTVEQDLQLRAIPDRLTELFENYIKWATDADPAVEIEVGPLEDENGFYVEDDAERPLSVFEDTFDLQYEVSDPGEGIEMRVVRSVLESHDWNWSLQQRDGGSARLNVSEVSVE